MRYGSSFLRSFLTVLFFLSFSQKSQALLCSQIFHNTIKNPLLGIVEKQADISIRDVIQIDSYRMNGCGAICATNLVEGLRIQQGLSPLDPYYQLQKLMSVINPNFQPNAFGSHGTGGTLKPLHVGSLKRLIEALMEKNEIEAPYTVSAFHKAPHQAYFAGERDIHFMKSLPEAAPFVVNEKESKILLVQVSDNNKHPSQSFLTAHFYTVVSFSDGIVTLHDPLVRGKLFRFELVPYTSGDGFQTMELKPLDPNYKLDRAFPDNVHYMVNGYVSVSN